MRFNIFIFSFCYFCCSFWVMAGGGGSGSGGASGASVPFLNPWLLVAVVGFAVYRIKSTFK